MRNSKIVALVAAAALLVVGAAFTAFAATGWVEENGSWKYYDKDGEAVTETWAKSGADYYWLDEDGELATEKLVDEGTYYVDASGRMVKNQWIAVPNDDDIELFGDDIWMYFQPSGKVLKASSGKTWSKKTVNGIKYIFDENGYMLFGWVGDEGMVSNENDDAFANADYYCGSKDDGAVRINKWEYLYVDEDGDDANEWFYFGSTGAKKTAADKDVSWNGGKYRFDAEGRMVSGWQYVNASSPSTSIAGYHCFSSAEDGAKKTKGWFYVTPEEKVDLDAYDAEDVLWFYADGKGNLKKNEFLSWGGKKYAFNEAGEMLSGLQYWDGVKFTAVGADEFDAYTALDTIYVPNPDEPKYGLYFFSNDGVNDGSMKTGNCTVDIDGDAYAFKFAAKGTGKGVGITKKDGNSFYVNGYKVVADGDLKYQIFTYDDTTKKLGAAVDAKDLKGQVLAPKSYVLLNASGTVMKASKTDADGYKITVKGGFVEYVDVAD